MWAAQVETVQAAQRFRLLQKGMPLSNQSFFELLATQEDFAGWYNSLLADVEAASYFWEFPALQTDTLEAQVEFVVVAGPRLATMHPDPAAFGEHFEAAGTASTVVFPNLGGDALLIAPVPPTAAANFPHLASFVRTADARQCCDLWMQTAKTVLNRLDDKPVWLSTSGLGIGWLHLRLDSTPKYYQHKPYRNARL